MNNSTTLFIVIGLAFLIGYGLVSAVFKRLGKGKGQPSTPRIGAIHGDPPSFGGDEDRYREVLGLGRPFTRGELERQYRQYLAECNPERLKNLGEEVHRAAAGRMLLINEAYEYFRRKYDLQSDL